MNSSKAIMLSTIALIISTTAIFITMTKKCTRTPPAEPQVKTVVTVRIDTLRVRDTITVPQPYLVRAIKRDTVIDTLKVIEDYFTEKRYELPYRDSNLSLTADVRVQKNSIEFAAINYELYRKTITIENTITHFERFSLLLGGGVGYNFAAQKPGLLVSGGIGIKKSQLSINYDFINTDLNILYNHKIWRK